MARPHELTRWALIAARGDMSGADLAKVLGIRRESVWMVEAGVRNPSPDLMVRWARVLGAPTVGAIWPKQDIDHARRFLEEIEETLNAIVA